SVRALRGCQSLTAQRPQAPPTASDIRASDKDDVEAFKARHGFAPALAVVIVGRDAPSAVYLELILRGCRNVGITAHRVELTGRVSAAALQRRIVELNEDPLVSGIIVQMPLPKRIPLSTVIDTLDPAKDIDGIDRRNFALMTPGYDAIRPTPAQAAGEIDKCHGLW